MIIVHFLNGAHLIIYQIIFLNTYLILGPYKVSKNDFPILSATYPSERLFSHFEKWFFLIGILILLHSAPDAKKIVNKSLSFDYRVIYFLLNNHFNRYFMRNPNFDSKELIYLILLDIFYKIFIKFLIYFK